MKIALAEALKQNQIVTQIDLRNNGIDVANQQAINEDLKTNIVRIKTTRNQTLLTLLILLRQAHSSQQNLPLEVWGLIINLFDFPSVKKGYRTSCAVASFLKQEAVFTEFNQRLQSCENFRLVETHGTKIGESRFSFLAPGTIMAQATVIPVEQSESLTKRLK